MTKIPPKRGLLPISFTTRLRENLKNIGDRMKVDEKKRKLSYQPAMNIGIKIVTRKYENGDVYIYRIK